jgi:hypothetical protein
VKIHSAEIHESWLQYSGLLTFPSSLPPITYTAVT